jgi:hypothetical protein
MPHVWCQWIIEGVSLVQRKRMHFSQLSGHIGGLVAKSCWLNNVKMDFWENLQGFNQKFNRNLPSWMSMQVPMKKLQTFTLTQILINNLNSISDLGSQYSFQGFFQRVLNPKRYENVKGCKTFSLDTSQRNQAFSIIYLHV